MLDRCGAWRKSGHGPASAEAAVRLQAYATLASVAVVGVSTADVTRTVVDEVGNSSFTFQQPAGPSDIQRHFITVGNGQTSTQLSFVLWASSSTTSLQGHSLQEFYLGSRNASNDIRFQSLLYQNDSVGLSAGTPFVLFSTWKENRGGTAATDAVPYTSGSQFFWPTERFFIGFTLGTPGSGSPEGWIEITYDPDAVSLTIHDWYVGAAGEEVLAGATVVPSLPALATLACGAAGLRRRRQRTVSNS